jgi:hypothetical protein
MLRRIFPRTGRNLPEDSARQAVLPLFPVRCRNVLLLTSFWVSVAVSSPFIVAPANISNNFPIASPAAETAPIGKAEFDPTFEFLPASGASLASIGEMPAQGSLANSMVLGERQRYESYPYLLLTAGLILLAFRPANPAVGGRY